jgi:hypothetical protein
MKLNLLLLSVAALFNAAAAIDPVDLGTAANYAILTKVGISTVPDSVITGDIAVSNIADTAITGFDLTDESGGTFSTATQITGKAYAATYLAPIPSQLTTAVSDMEAAYTDAAGRETDATRYDLGAGTLGGTLGGAFGGLTNPLTAGVYTFETSVTIAGDIFFDGDADADAVFILRMTGSFKQYANTTMTLTGGAQAKNIFWQVDGAVGVEVGAHLEGIVLAKTTALFKTGSSLNGRVLAQMACDLEMATITQPSA